MVAKSWLSHASPGSTPTSAACIYHHGYTAYDAYAQPDANAYPNTVHDVVLRSYLRVGGIPPVFHNTVFGLLLMNVPDWSMLGHSKVRLAVGQVVGKPNTSG